MADSTSAAAAAAGNPDTMAKLVALVRYLISNVLSYGVVFGASILKVPQILNVVMSGSAEGISLTSNYVETFSYVISTSWGIVQHLDFRDFGENAFIFLQLIALILMVARLQNKTQQAISVLLAELTTFYFFSTGFLPRAVHESLLSAQILLNISSRVPQIMLNYRNKSTGQLSFVTCFLAFGGGVARILTTALNVPREKGKYVLLLQYSVAASLNSILIAQILYYRYKYPERVAKGKSDKKKASPPPPSAADAAARGKTARKAQ